MQMNSVQAGWLRAGHWRRWVLMLAGCAVAGAVMAQEDFSGVVTSVTDGDTLVVKPRARKPVTVRLTGVDAPESCQTGGRAAKDALVRKLDHRTVLVEYGGRDSYGRTIGRVLLDGQDIGEWLVASGMAWNYRGPYAVEERQARASKRGVHAQRSPVRPWDYRRDYGPCSTTAATPVTSSGRSAAAARDVDVFVVGTTSLTTSAAPRTGTASSFTSSTSSRTRQDELDRLERLERLRAERARQEQLRLEKVRLEKIRQDKLRREREQRALREQQYLPSDEFDAGGYSSTPPASRTDRDRLRY